MINYIKLFLVVLLLAATTGSFAQTMANTSSPYSKFGIGLYSEPLLPQNLGMGGIGVGISKSSALNDINVINPASYSNIGLTAIDISGAMNTSMLSQSGTSGETSNDFYLSHVAFAVPTGKHAAISFGLLPYSNVGYDYSVYSSVKLNNSPIGIDTSTNVKNIYSGQGGLSKAYLGYGLGIGHLSLGVNVSYIFGNAKQFSSAEFDGISTALSTRVENSFSAGGFNFDLGAQYNIYISDTRRLTLGYSISPGSSIDETTSYYVSHYIATTDGSPAASVDTVYGRQSTGKISLPTISRYGISYNVENKYVFGADFTTGSWSTLTVGGINAGLVNNTSFKIGGQFTPNINAISNYWSVVDYRFGLNYENTYINTNGITVKQYGATFGFGFPLPNERRTTFYKINFSAEVGKRGTADNGLVKENYINLHLGFTINDKWFQKYKFE